jgi:Flp pilus assembly protein TadG
MRFPAAASKSLQTLACSLDCDPEPAESQRMKLTLFSRLRSRLTRCEQANAMVEFALVLPLVMIILTGMVTMGILLDNFLMLSHATDVGARNLAVSIASANPCEDTVNVIKAAAPGINSANITYTISLTNASNSSQTDTFSGTGANGTGSGTNNFGASGSSSCGVQGVADMVTGNTARVTASYPYQMFIYGWRPTTVTISASTSEVIQ